MSKKVFNVVLALIVIITFSIDMVTKFAILNMFDNAPYPMSQPVLVWGNFFRLTYVQNFGITFGMLNDLPKPMTAILLSMISLLAGCVLVYFFLNVQKIVQKKVVPITKIALALICGGALGNIADRIMHGFVVDFLDFGTMTYRWYTFNFADVFIVSGCILLGILLTLFELKKEKISNIKI